MSYSDLVRPADSAPSVGRTAFSAGVVLSMNLSCYDKTSTCLQMTYAAQRRRAKPARSTGRRTAPCPVTSLLQASGDCAPDLTTVSAHDSRHLDCGAVRHIQQTPDTPAAATAAATPTQLRLCEKPHVSPQNTIQTCKKHNSDDVHAIVVSMKDYLRRKASTQQFVRVPCPSIHRFPSMKS